jgi:MFS family permease
MNNKYLFILSDCTLMQNLLERIASRYGKFSKSTKILIIFEFLAAIQNGIISFLLIFYIRYIGYSPVIYGLITSISGLVFLLFVLPSGIISSKIGAKSMIKYGILISILSLIILLFFKDVPFLIFSGALSGLSWAFVQPGFGSLLASSSPPEERNYVFSLNGFSNLLGMSIGTVIGGYFPSIGRYFFNNDLYGYKLSFVFSILIFLILFFFFKNIEIDIKMERGKRIELPRDVKITLIKLTLPAMLIGFGAGFVIPYFQLQFKYRFGISIESISYIFAITDVLMAILMLYIPFVSERVGTLKTIVALWLLATISLFMMPFISYLPFGFYIFSSLYVIRTILMNVAGPIQSSFEFSLIPKEYRMITSSLLSLAWVGMNSLSAYFGGLLIVYSLNIPFYICTSFYLSSAIMYWIFFKNYIPRFKE